MSDDIYQPYQNHILTWFRYIDDIFVVWDGPRSLFDEFFERLNDNTFNLCFTMQVDSSKLSFLDVEVRVDESGRLAYIIFRKPTAGNTLLISNSAYPSPLKCSILFGQFLRLRRICSNQTDFHTQADLLRDRLHLCTQNPCSKKLIIML